MSTEDPWLPKPPPQPKRRRCEKTRYDKKAAATQINLAMKRRRNRPASLRSYYCEECEAWHLTHKEP